MTLADRLAAALEEALPAAVRLRRELHANPERSGIELRTAATVAAALAAESEPIAGTGRVVRIGPAGPSIAIRAELDALPVEERTGATYASTNGVMHACGHDVHLAALAAFGTSARRVPLPVALLAVLQPREEIAPSGASDVVATDLLQRHDVRAFLATHVHPGVPAGAIAVGGGPVNAAADEFDIVVTGHGGHAAYPHLTRDPVLALCAAVLALQQVVSRRFDPLDAVTVSVSMLSAGEAPNVIPDTARARGTLRALQPSNREPLQQVVADVVASTAAAYGCAGEVHIPAGEPVLVNDEALAAAAARHLAAAGVPVAPPMRSTGADDFAFYAQRVPALMMFAGVRTAGAGDIEPTLHSAGFLPPDEAVGLVARSLLAGYLAALELVDRCR